MSAGADPIGLRNPIKTSAFALSHLDLWQRRERAMGVGRGSLWECWGKGENLIGRLLEGGGGSPR